MNNYQDVLERLEQATGNEVFCDVMCRFPYELNEEQLTEVCERCPLNNTLDKIVEDIKGMNKYYLDTEIVLEIIDKHKAESKEGGTLLPEGHGRLIDADKLRAEYTKPHLVGYDEIIADIDRQPTVVESEGIWSDK